MQADIPLRDCVKAIVGVALRGPLVKVAISSES